MPEENKKSSNPEGPKHTIVQTYAEDMAGALSGGKGGVIKNIIHSEEEHERERRNLSPESRKNRFFMLLGSLFILASFGTLSYFLLSREVPSVGVVEQFVPIIFTDNEVLLELADLKPAEIKAKIFKQAQSTSVVGGGIDGIYPTLGGNAVGLREFFSLVESNLTLSQGSSIEDNFLMGVFKQEPDKNFFILLKTRSMIDVFDSMRAWEPKMFTDLYGFFGLELNADTKYLLTASFEDGIIENKNARILYTKEELEGEKKIVMMYVFADDNSVVIANSAQAVREIILRLASSQIKR